MGFEWPMVAISDVESETPAVMPMPACPILLLLFAVAPQSPPHELPGLHNVHRATGTVYLGSEPHGEQAFAELQKLGITTIVSVDGAIPDVEVAKKYGLRYIHIPLGYDAVDSDAAKALTRVAREIKTPLYVHCHHGKHRGPAAAAIVCIAAGSLKNEQAIELMKKAGTGKDYVGLWRDVNRFVPPSANIQLPELVEVAKVESMAAAMAKLDRHFDNLKACAKADWQTPASHPDLVPAAEALLVQEGLHESQRHCSGAHDATFREWLKESDTLASGLYAAVKAEDKASAATLLKSLEQKCVQCHQAYRNQ
jgi:protein tyrosine phosphatase (PTP) superfamily phosphohydrolase (DUF442 family)